jgi:hypothetical protein
MIYPLLYGMETIIANAKEASSPAGEKASSS